MTHASSPVTMLLPQQPGIPVPRTSARLAPYWEGCRRGELLHVRCEGCDRTEAWPFTICSRCGGRAVTWAPGRGLGHLYSWTVVWRPQHPAFSVPYAPAVVALDEGHFTMSAVIGCAPEELRARMRLAVEFHPASHDLVLPYFRPADDDDRGAVDGEETSGAATAETRRRS